MKWTTMNQQVGLNGQYKSVRQKWANLLSLIFTAHWAAFLFCFLMHLSSPRQVLWLSSWGQFHWPQQLHEWLDWTEVPFHLQSSLLGILMLCSNDLERSYTHEIAEETYERNGSKYCRVSFDLCVLPYLKIIHQSNWKHSNLPFSTSSESSPVEVPNDFCYPECINLDDCLLFTNYHKRKAMKLLKLWEQEIVGVSSPRILSSVSTWNNPFLSSSPLFFHLLLSPGLFSSLFLSLAISPPSLLLPVH